LQFIAKFPKVTKMIDDSEFFRKKFIDYYNINMSKIELLFADLLKEEDILRLSLSDAESQLLLSYSSDEKFLEENMNNNHILEILIKNLKSISSEEDFRELTLRTNRHIKMSRYIVWNRDLILYIVFDIDKINIAFANKKIDNIIKNIESILN